MYVADFIGDVNIISGKAKPLGDGCYDVKWAEGQTPFKASSDVALKYGQECHIALRPEKVAITSERPDDAVNAVQGQVHDIAYLGNISTYHVELSNGEVIKAQMANTRRVSRRSFSWDDPVWLSWTPTAGVLLDR